MPLFCSGVARFVPVDIYYKLRLFRAYERDAVFNVGEVDLSYGVEK